MVARNADRFRQLTLERERGSRNFGPGADLKRAMNGYTRYFQRAAGTAGGRNPERNRLDETPGTGDPQRRLLQSGTGTIWSALSQDAGLSRFHDHREDQAGNRRGNPAIRKEAREW